MRALCENAPSTEHNVGVTSFSMTPHSVSAADELCVLIGDALPGTRPPPSCWQNGASGLVLATDGRLSDALLCACPRTATPKRSTRGPRASPHYIAAFVHLCPVPLHPCISALHGRAAALHCRSV